MKREVLVHLPLDFFGFSFLQFPLLNPSCRGGDATISSRVTLCALSGGGDCGDGGEGPGSCPRYHPRTFERVTSAKGGSRRGDLPHEVNGDGSVIVVEAVLLLLLSGSFVQWNMTFYCRCCGANPSAVSGGGGANAPC